MTMRTGSSFGGIVVIAVSLGGGGGGGGVGGLSSTSSTFSCQWSERVGIATHGLGSHFVMLVRQRFCKRAR